MLTKFYTKLGILAINRNLIINMKLNITLKVQSISDLITNSSSETFLTIQTEDQNLHKEIYEVLTNLLPSCDRDLSPVITDETEYYREEGYKEFVCTLSLPYGMECDAFFEVGITAILKDLFGEENYIITRLD